MRRFIEGQDRHQVALIPECLDDFIADDLPPQSGQFITGEWLPLWVVLTTFERTHSGSDDRVNREDDDGCNRPAKLAVFAAGRAA